MGCKFSTKVSIGHNLKYFLVSPYAYDYMVTLAPEKPYEFLYVWSTV